MALPQDMCSSSSITGTTGNSSSGVTGRSSGTSAAASSSTSAATIAVAVVLEDCYCTPVLALMSHHQRWPLR
jgi:hypothetical protein